MEKVNKIADLVLLLSFLMIISSCKQHTDDPLTTIHVDLDKEDSRIWGNIFTDVEIIPLELTSESILVNIEKVLFQDGNYLIFDKDQSFVYKFNDEGEFLSKLDKVGNGPGEYQSIYDVIINPYNDNIELMSAIGSIYIYDKNFNWIETIDLPDIRSVHKFQVFSEDIIALYSYDFDIDGNLLLYSRTKKEYVRKISPKSTVFERKNFVMLSNPLVKSPDGLMYCAPFSNEVYNIGLDGTKLAYTWDFGKYNFDPGSVAVSDSQEDVQKVIDSNINRNFATFYTYLENGSKIFMQFMFKGEVGNLVYHKEIADYKVYLGHVAANAAVLLDDGFVAYSQREHLEKTIPETKRKLFMDELYLDHNHEDNPYLVKYRFNDLIEDATDVSRER